MDIATDMLRRYVLSCLSSGKYAEYSRGVIIDHRGGLFFFKSMFPFWYRRYLQLCDVCMYMGPDNSDRGLPHYASKFGPNSLST